MVFMSILLNYTIKLNRPRRFHRNLNDLFQLSSEGQLVGCWSGMPKYLCSLLSNGQFVELSQLDIKERVTCTN